jgi:SpoVK/Ycf46/Vps4 family AAA+-type ATPase
MARADLLCDLIKYGLTNDFVNFRKAAEAICAEERSNQHGVLANKLEEILQQTKTSREMPIQAPKNGNGNGEGNLFIEKIPVKRLEQLILPSAIVSICKEIIEEQARVDVLRSYGMEPRNKILLVGPPGNGKTSLAEALAEALMIPLYTVKYESIVGAYLGETATRLSKLFEYAKTRHCVLFFDEFETVGKERGDTHETGEIKRVVSSLLLQIDALPSYVVAIAATNHDSLLDKAVWRRFQVKIELPKPSRSSIEAWFNLFIEKSGFNFESSPGTLAKKLLGRSYSEVEDFALAVYRRYVLNLPNANVKDITDAQIKALLSQYSRKEVESACDMSDEEGVN